MHHSFTGRNLFAIQTPPLYLPALPPRSRTCFMKTAYRAFLAAALLACLTLFLPAMENNPPEGFVSLFNGKDFAGWKVPEGDNGHWKIVDGVIDYDARSEAKGAKDLVSEKEYGNFVLKFDWRIKDTPWINPNIPYVLPDGTHARGVDGKELRLALP